MSDDPLMMVLKLTESSNKHSCDYIMSILKVEHEVSGIERSKMKMKIYLKLNANLFVHPVY